MVTLKRILIATDFGEAADVAFAYGRELARKFGASLDVLHVVDNVLARGYAGATVFRAIMGFGASAHVRTDRVEVLSLDLPIVVECVETEEKIDAILPELDAMIGGGLITLERARVIMYRPGITVAER